VSIGPNVAYGSLGDIPRCRGQVRFAPKTTFASAIGKSVLCQIQTWSASSVLAMFVGQARLRRDIDIAQRQACKHSVVS
jgi:hypothetical protein